MALGGSLAASEVTTCTSVSPVGAVMIRSGVISATAVVTGTTQDGTAITATNLAHYEIVAPAIGLEAYTNGYEADTLEEPRTQLVNRAPVVWAYRIANLGDTPLTDNSLVDNRLGVVGCPQVSLDIGSSMVCVVTGTAQLAQTSGGIYTNTATVVASIAPRPPPQLPKFAPTPLPPVSTIDRSHYEVITASLNGRVWNDTNVDGRQDPGESGVADITVELLNRLGRTVTTSATNADGRYFFALLDPGAYTVRFRPETLPAGYRFTRADQGVETQDSDANPLTGLSAPMTLTGRSRATVDAGVFAVRFGIELEKRINGRAIADPSAGNIPQIAPGAPVVWSYVVTNTSNVRIERTAIDVTDDVAGSLMQAGQLQALGPEFGSASFGSPNSLADGALEPGEAFELQVTWPAPDLGAHDPTRQTPTRGYSGVTIAPPATTKLASPTAARPWYPSPAPVPRT